jgi:hypothetical protein
MSLQLASHVNQRFIAVYRVEVSLAPQPLDLSNNALAGVSLRFGSPHYFSAQSGADFTGLCRANTLAFYEWSDC